MLSVQNQNRSGANQGEDSLRGFADSISSIVALATEIISNRPPEPPPAQVLGCRAFENETDTVMNFEFIFARNNRLFSLILPVFMDLQERSVGPQVQNNQQVSQPVPRRKWKYVGAFMSIIYHPFVMLAAGMVSIINVLNITPLARVGIIPRVLSTISFPLKALSLAASIVYFSPLLYKRVKRDLRKHFDEILADINANELDSAQEKLKNSSLQYRMLLNVNPPGMKSLQWSYYYLQGLLSEKRCEGNRFVSDESLFVMALTYAESPEEKFLALRGIINHHDMYLLNRQHEYRDMQHRADAFVLELQGNAYNQRYSKGNIATYFAQIPTTIALYEDTGRKLHAELQSCIAALSDDRPEEAIEIFRKIKLDGYCKQAYPAAAILYYQLDSVTLFLIHKCGLTRDNMIFTTEMLITDWYREIRENSKLIQECFDKYFPERAEEYKAYVNAFEQAKYEKDCAFFTQPTPFTPLAVMMAEENAIPLPMSAGNITAAPEVTIETTEKYSVFVGKRLGY